MILYYNNDAYVYRLSKLSIRESIIIPLRDIVILMTKHNVIIISI